MDEKGAEYLISLERKERNLYLIRYNDIKITNQVLMRENKNLQKKVRSLTQENMDLKQEKIPKLTDNKIKDIKNNKLNIQPELTNITKHKRKLFDEDEEEDHDQSKRKKKNNIKPLHMIKQRLESLYSDNDDNINNSSLISERVDNIDNINNIANILKELYKLTLENPVWSCPLCTHTVEAAKFKSSFRYRLECNSHLSRDH